MKLIRNTTNDGSCKYALIRLDKLKLRLKNIFNIPEYLYFLLTLGKDSTIHLKKYIEFGLPNSDEEFFVIKLKDKHSKAALTAYADSVESSDPELAKDVRELANRAGVDHSGCKEPD